MANSSITQKMLEMQSELRILDNLSIKGFLANEKIKQRQAKFKAFSEREKVRLEKEKDQMAHRAIQKIKAEQQQMLNKTNIQASNRRLTRSMADDAFSFCVRLRANCTCERCGEKFPMNAMKHLHCSHNYSREYKQVRFHPDNAIALCKDCHRWFAWNKELSTAWKNEYLGEAKLKRLFQALQNDPVEISKAEERRITAYYRIVARYLVKLREEGNTDYLDFAPYSPFNLNLK